MMFGKPRERLALWIAPWLMPREVAFPLYEITPEGILQQVKR